VKAYLRYGPAPARVFGVVASPDSQVAYDWSGRFVITGALERIVIWNIRLGAPVCSLVDPTNSAAVTVLALSPNKRHIAAGYADGVVRLWEWAGGQAIGAPVALAGHRSAVTCLAFEEEHATGGAAVGQLLCSGGKDGRLVVWDTLQQKGLFRLQGHKDQITQCRFLSARAGQRQEGGGGAHTGLGLASSSKDGLLKVWDLETQHCVQTVVGHRREVWAFCVDRAERRLYSGTSDGHLRLWALEWRPLDAAAADEEEEEEGAADARAACARYGLPFVRCLGSVPREAKERVMDMRLSPSGGLLAVQANDRRAEFFMVFDEQEAAKRGKKRVRRVLKKRERRAAEGGAPPAGGEAPPPAFAGSDELVAVYQIRAKHKVRALDFAPYSPQVVLSLYNNSFEVYDLSQSGSKLNTQVNLPGHESDIRALALSSDDNVLLSASNTTAKLWNLATTNCVRTLATGFGLCCAFVPGNRQVVIGTKEGALELYDVASGEQLERLEAHGREVWSLCVSPDQQTLVSGGADKELKFWRFAMRTEGRRRRVTLQQERSVVMEHDILQVLYSRDMRFVAVALLDNTVKVFYADTMKFFLSLFGHSLPVMAMDISSDSTLLVTGSADKNVKLWGMDFGDCHRSLFAHDDSVMQVKFVPNSHYFFTAGKDGTIKYWDGDTYEQIQVLRGHHSQVWSLAMSRDAEFIVSGARDRSIRVWHRTEEQVFIEEEREQEMEQLFQAGVDEQAPLEEGAGESAVAGTTTLETVKAGERIMEALEQARAEAERWREYEAAVEAAQEQEARRATLEQQYLGTKRPRDAAAASLPAPPPPNPFLLGRSGSGHVLAVVRGVAATDLEQALMVLPFSDTLAVLEYLLEWLREGKSVELCCKILFLLLGLHHSRIVSNKALVATLTELQAVARQRLKEQKDTIGFNKAAMLFMQRSIEQKNEESLFYTALASSKAKKKGNKKRRVANSSNIVE